MRVINSFKYKKKCQSGVEQLCGRDADGIHKGGNSVCDAAEGVSTRAEEE